MYFFLFSKIYISLNISVRQLNYSEDEDIAGNFQQHLAFSYTYTYIIPFLDDHAVPPKKIKH
jgi:hypothetical protein